jgi:hypothetical protein
MIIAIRLGMIFIGGKLNLAGCLRMAGYKAPIFQIQLRIGVEILVLSNQEEG